MLAIDLPMGSAPTPVALPHFPDRLHAFVWRNWTLVPTEKLAQVVGAKPEEIRRLGRDMGLPAAPRVSKLQWRRSALTIIRRNWHLLPYEQLLTLLDWTPEEMAFTLREDDFLYIKLGSLKPRCEPIRYKTPDATTQQTERRLAQTIQTYFPQGLPATKSPLFQFVSDLSKRTGKSVRAQSGAFAPRYGYSYFALYGDPLLEKEADPYPEGYLERLAASGVDGVWLQGVLYKLAPFPWNPELSARYEERLKNLRSLVARAKRYGIGIYLYLNEPRAMPLSFFEPRPTLQGVTESDYATLCTSHPDVQRYLTESVASLCRAVPDLAGVFTITASENLTNCWSHGRGRDCPRCKERGAATVIAEVNGLIQQGINQSGSKTQLIAWDWGWAKDAAEQTIQNLPREAALMSVSEWDMPIRRGGVESVIGEYSVSAVGPGPRAKRHWAWAKQRGLKTLAKIQAANSWELSAVPYLPALANVAQHIANLRESQVDGLMLGWTLGGYPSPNLEVVAAMGSDRTITPDEALQRVATARFGAKDAPQATRFWQEFSKAYQEFPYHIGVVYTAPMQFGPSNLLWEKPTGYAATMIGFPYDDLTGWRQVYPPDIFVSQLRKVAEGFGRALSYLPSEADSSEALRGERRIAEAARIHFQSTANQARFVALREALAKATKAQAARPILAELERLLNEEIDLAKRLYTLQTQDSRIGFEASNQYYYVPVDLLEKIVNCADLRDRWLPAERAQRGL